MSKRDNTALGSFKYRNAELRERILSGGSALLSRTRMPLWYLETLVLSARYYQRVNAPGFGTKARKVRYPDRERLWRDAVIPALRSAGRPVRALEFGVASGRATSWWHAHLPELVEWHGFDTFEGLPQPWTRGGVTVMEQGVFALADGGAESPEIDAVCPIVWHKGLIENTIGVAERGSDDVLLVLIDVDILEPTRSVLEWLEQHGRPGDCVYFDEAFDPFNEGLALGEAMERGLTFSVLGYTGSALAIVLE